MLKTIPQQFGVRKTKLIGLVMLLLIVFLEGWKATVPTAQFFALVCVVLLSGSALLLAKKQPGRYYASFWVEGIPIVWCILLLLFGHFLA